MRSGIEYGMRFDNAEFVAVLTVSMVVKLTLHILIGKSIF